MAAVLEELANRDARGDQAAEQVEPLTDRERQVLELLSTDLTLRDIGRELFVSRNTAKTHLASAYRKLGVTSRSAAIARARANSSSSERHARCGPQRWPSRRTRHLTGGSCDV